MTIGRASQLFLHFRRYTDLSLCSRMSSNLCSENNCTLSKNWCITEPRIDEVTFDWIIKNFNFHEAKGIDLKSPIFTSYTNDKLKWYLICEPNGNTGCNDTVSLGLRLANHTELAESVLVSKTFSIRNYNSPIVGNTRSFEVDEYTASRSWGWGGMHRFIEKDKRFKDYLTSNENRLIISCNVKFSKTKNFDSSLHRCPLKMSASNLSNDLAIPFEKLEFLDPDTIIFSSGKVFSAHKTILAARSPVFAAMYNTTQQNRFFIEDVNEEVMAEMLRYIYSETCQNLEKFPEELLVAADKYALDGLKIMCLKELGKTLSVENAVKILVLADLHNAKDLKVEAIKFIVSKFAEIVKTSAWKDILLSNPQLTNEVCEAIAR